MRKFRLRLPGCRKAIKPELAVEPLQILAVRKNAAMAENCPVNYHGHLSERTARAISETFFMPISSQLFLAVRRVAILSVMLLLLCGNHGFAQEETASVEISVGIGGVAKLGHWLPVSFKVPEESPLREAKRFRVTVLDGDDTPNSTTGSVFKTKDGVQGLVQFGRTYGDATFELLDSNDEVLDSVMAVIREEDNDFMKLIPSTGRLYACIDPLADDEDAGESLLASSLEFAFPGGIEDDDRVSLIRSFDDLPQIGLAWESCDSVVMLAGEKTTLNPGDETIDAIETWVTNGGHLVICASPEQAALFDGPLKRFAPGKIQGIAELDSSRRLEEFCESNEPFLGRRESMKVLNFENIEGRVALGQGDLPLVIRLPMGLGEVAVVTFDPTSEKFREWNATNRFMQSLMKLRLGSENTNAGTARSDARSGTAVRHSGYKDLVGQMKVPLERFTSLRFIPFVLIALLIALYILCIGVGDWFLVGRLFKKHELTWITFPLLAALFCGIAWYATKVSRPATIQLNQIELIDVDSVSGHVRATNWVNVYNPVSRTVDLGIGAGKAAEDRGFDEQTSRLTWLGLPGDGLGGMLNRANPGLYRSGYVNEVTLDPSQPSDVNLDMQGVSLQVSSTRPLLGQWTGKFNTHVASRLRMTDRLEGTLINPFDVPLKDCRLFHENVVYVVEGTFAADDDIDIRSDTTEKTIRSYLTRRSRSNNDNNKSQSVAWDTRDVNLSRIMQMMMFFHGSGGESYTGLTHAYHDFIEMTPQCSMDRAILVGRLTDRVSTIKLDGKDADELYDSSLTYVRVLIPVARRKITPRK
jgi:hypothetical protein